jgi:uncharacterized protein (TIGR02300 family)
MSKSEWGTKRTCPNCNARFYDMCHQPISCPKCDNVFEQDAFIKKRRGRPPALEAKQLPLPPELAETLDLELAEELVPLDDSDNVLEDTSDFGEGEDVVGIDTVTDED